MPEPVNYQKEQFNRTLFNPLEKNLLKTYPRLLGLFPNEDERPIEEREKLLRYVIALYDPASPLQKEYPELLVRKEMAALLAGFDLAKDEARLVELYSCLDDSVVELIIAYLKIVRNRTWSMIVSIEQTVWEYNLRLLSPISKGDKGDKDLVAAVNMKSKMAEDLGVMNERLDEYLKKFYGDDEDLITNAKKVERITAESVAGVKR